MIQLRTIRLRALRLRRPHKPRATAACCAALSGLLIAGAVIPSVASASYASTVTGTAGLVSYWRLGETSGTVAGDAAGSNPGAYLGGSGYTLGVPGLVAHDSNTGVAFNGATGYVSIPDSASLHPRTAMALEAWIKPSAGVSLVNQFIATKGNSFRLRFDSAGHLTFGVYAGGAETQANSGQALTGGQVYDVVGTYDGAYVRLFLNGKQVAASALTGTLSSSSMPLNLGTNGVTGHFNGVLDDVAYYHTALTPTQALSHYVAGTSSGSPSPGPGSSSCTAAYSPTGPWNTSISSGASYNPNTSQLVTTIGSGTAVLTSDPTQYTLPVYDANSSTPLRTVTYGGWFSDVENGVLTDYRYGGDLALQTVKVPIPAGVAASAGSDANLTLINTSNGDEWDLHDFTQDASGNYTAGNVGHYNLAWSGYPGFDQNGYPWWLRGSGVPYLAGLIRPCEIAQGHIDHALAIGIPAPSSGFVYPATKSDGSAAPGAGIPEGGHLQLDPTIPDSTITNTWKCTGSCYIIAKAMQKYGMYVTDSSGRPKITAEDDLTAKWGSIVTASTVSPIPISALKLLK